MVYSIETYILQCTTFLTFQQTNLRISAGFEAVGGGDHFVTSPLSYNDGEWHYAVVTNDGSSSDCT